jgi:hypothetical protein
LNKLIIAFLLSFSLTVHSHGISCIPENDLYISHQHKGLSDVTEATFNKAIADFQEIYEDIIKENFNANLDIKGDWEDGTVNAYARRLGRTWEVQMFGGLARHQEATLDGFKAVLCHEIGHHLGGAPKYSGLFNRWASSEGQSDYFATAKCLPRLFEQQEEKTLKIYNKENLTDEEKFAKEKCDKTYTNEFEAAKCFRSGLAGQALARLLGSLRGNPDVKFSEPDSSVVDSTQHGHPAAQCRLDTYFQGALCVNDFSVLPDNRNVSVGYCTEVDQFLAGLRPHCWYNPKDYE